MIDRIVRSFFAQLARDPQDPTSMPSAAVDALVRENARLAHELHERDELIARLVDTAEKTAVVLEDLEEIAALSAESLREMVKEIREKGSAN